MAHATKQSFRSSLPLNLSRSGAHIFAVLITTLLWCACGSTPTTPGAGAAVAAIIVTGTPPSLNQTSQFSASALLSNATSVDVTNSAGWRSSDVSVVTVSANGLVRAVGVGQAAIFATYQNFSGDLPVQVTSEGPRSFRVTGTVTDARTGAGISGASVAAIDGLTVPHSTSTSSSGAYSLESMAAGVVSISVLASGYAPLGKTVTVSAATTVDFALAR